MRQRRGNDVGACGIRGAHIHASVVRIAVCGYVRIRCGVDGIVPMPAGYVEMPQTCGQAFKRLHIGQRVQNARIHRRVGCHHARLLRHGRRTHTIYCLHRIAVLRALRQACVCIRITLHQRGVHQHTVSINVVTGKMVGDKLAPHDQRKTHLLQRGVVRHRQPQAIVLRVLHRVTRAQLGHRGTRHRIHIAWARTRKADRHPIGARRQRGVDLRRHLHDRAGGVR